jgi:hypothetical protein
MEIWEFEVIFDLWETGSQLSSISQPKARQKFPVIGFDFLAAVPKPPKGSLYYIIKEGQTGRGHPEPKRQSGPPVGRTRPVASSDRGVPLPLA